MRLPSLDILTGLSLARAGMLVSDLATPTIRLGVTGLSRSGKTVFITALVRCLTQGSANPALERVADVPGLRAFLEPQPDDDVPRFQYEEHLAALEGPDPYWPASTRRISQLRLTLEWPGQDLLRESLGLSQRLHIDIIDYPGEWLIDLGLLSQSFAQWSGDALVLARSPALAKAAGPFLGFAGSVAPDGAADEQVAIHGARLFTEYLAAARKADPSLAVLGPGRFLLPGDLEGSPQLTFFPLDVAADATARPGSLRALLERRFESYKSNIVQPFFRAHFSRLDRQIVLIDALNALNGGARALENLEHGLEGVLTAFRPGANSWLSFILPRRIDRIVFAATKADHIHASSHRRLEAILAKAVARASGRAAGAGAGTAVVALAALRSTEDVETVAGGERFRCVRGVPEAGEMVGGRRFDGKKPAVVFPGDLPADPLDAFEAERARPEDYQFVRFRPPARMAGEGEAGAPAWPHIGLDEAIAFLIGDHLP